MLDGEITDALEATALSFNLEHVDIYSASWGPDDRGMVPEGPGKLTYRAMLDGITKGRKGRGSIYVWAAGDGGMANDSCSCDGYASSIYTISVNSVAYDNTMPRYDEKCPSTLATTYSSGTTPITYSISVSHWTKANKHFDKRLRKLVTSQ